MGLRVLSLFDGMSCGRIALERAGFEIDEYFASEVDNHAIKVSKANYPDIVHLGDVRDIKNGYLPIIDIIIGGSPCQGFSFAGKGLNFDDPRSKLFFEYVRLVNDLKPEMFLLENVQMKYESELVISRYMGVNPIVINSRLVSAQNRVRNYWTNINSKPVGLFGELVPDIPQPKDKNIYLGDVLQKKVDEKYFLTEKTVKRLLNESVCGGFKSVIKEENDKSSTIFASQHKISRGMDLICVAMRGRESILSPKRTEYGKQIRKDYEAGKIKEQRKNIQQLEPRDDNKTNTLTSVQKDNLLLIREATKKGFTEIKPGECFDFENPNSNTRRGRKMSDKSNTLMAAQNNFYHFTSDYRIRRLTEIECERLQTVPDNYTNHVSSTQRYKMCGNGWTVDVIAHILSFIK